MIKQQDDISQRLKKAGIITKIKDNKVFYEFQGKLDAKPIFKVGKGKQRKV